MIRIKSYQSEILMPISPSDDNATDFEVEKAPTWALADIPGPLRQAVAMSPQDYRVLHLEAYAQKVESYPLHTLTASYSPSGGGAHWSSGNFCGVGEERPPSDDTDPNTWKYVAKNLRVGTDSLWTACGVGGKASWQPNKSKYESTEHATGIISALRAHISMVNKNLYVDIYADETKMNDAPILLASDVTDGDYLNTDFDIYGSYRYIYIININSLESGSYPDYWKIEYTSQSSNNKVTMTYVTGSFENQAEAYSVVQTICLPNITISQDVSDEIAKQIKAYMESIVDPALKRRVMV